MARPRRMISGGSKGVHPTTVYRRWHTKSRLIGEAMLEAPAPLITTPDMGALETDLLQLLTEAAALTQGARFERSSKC